MLRKNIIDNYDLMNEKDKKKLRNVLSKKIEPHTLSYFYIYTMKLLYNKARVKSVSKRITLKEENDFDFEYIDVKTEGLLIPYDEDYYPKSKLINLINTNLSKIPMDEINEIYYKIFNKLFIDMELLLSSVSNNYYILFYYIINSDEENSKNKTIDILKSLYPSRSDEKTLKMEYFSKLMALEKIPKSNKASFSDLYKFIKT